MPKPINRREWLKRGLLSSLPFLSTAAGAKTATPAQTEGPFYPRRQADGLDNDLTRASPSGPRARGQLIKISGQVRDSNNQPISGAFIDVWQANSLGRYKHPADNNPAPLDEHFQGWGQLYCDENGRYEFTTVMPGAYPVYASWTRPPHIHIKASKRGYQELTTQIYFAGETLNSSDRILNNHSRAEQQQLIVALETHTSGPDHGVFNIVLKGAS